VSPSTNTDVSLLVAADSLPAVSASASMLAGSESVFARLDVDDMRPGQPRHSVHLSLIGPRAAVLEAVDRLRAAVEAALPPEGAGT
jgi:hypothetical protein